MGVLAWLPCGLNLLLKSDLEGPALISQTIGDWHPECERRTSSGHSHPGVNVGAMLTPVIVPLILVTLPWP